MTMEIGAPPKRLLVWRQETAPKLYLILIFLNIISPLLFLISYFLLGIGSILSILLVSLGIGGISPFIFFILLIGVSLFLLLLTIGYLKLILKALAIASHSCSCQLWVKNVVSGKTRQYRFYYAQDVYHSIFAISPDYKTASFLEKELKKTDIQLTQSEKKMLEDALSIVKKIKPVLDLKRKQPYFLVKTTWGNILASMYFTVFTNAGWGNFIENVFLCTTDEFDESSHICVTMSLIPEDKLKEGFLLLNLSNIVYSIAQTQKDSVRKATLEIEKSDHEITKRSLNEAKMIVDERRTRSFFIETDKGKVINPSVKKYLKWLGIILIGIILFIGIDLILKALHII